MYSEGVSKVTAGIRVIVKTAFIPGESSPKHNHYVFAYQIEIQNEGPYKVQLLRRKWIIRDGSGLPKVVEGSGVVGETPELESGESFRYGSGCNLRTPIGKMYGTYKMVRLSDGEEFEVRIPTFVLAAPFVLN